MPTRSLLTVLLLLVGCGGTDVDLGTQIDVRDVRLTQEEGAGVPYISGTLVNLTDTPIPSVQVQVNLYDAHNAKVDEMIFPVHDLAPGAEVPFREAVNSEAAVASADLVVLATPVNAIISLLPRVLDLISRAAVVIDLGSTKAQADF